jgi:Tol biopolymer transport system component
MGEVYRARDERLGREVAVKVLPSGLSADKERLQRFEREARAAGALNHPHILAVYDIGRHDGSPYVVSELLEGQTLRDRLGGGALPPRKAVEIGVQIARGLAAAHEKGIVHRDLKPENVFVTNDGHVKILDFGLAKLTHAEGGAGPDESPTRTRQTDPGVVLGTAGYMSPEQVRGGAVDHRSDIFSFGILLYEMLAGRRPFKKETSAETMAAILREDPPNLLDTNATLPPALERIVRHCLEKAPPERFASARDLAFDLESLSEASGPARATTGGPGFLAPLGKAGLAASWVASVLAALAAGAYWMGRGGDGGPLPTYTRLTYGHGHVTAARFSPDGGSVLYSARWRGGPARIYSMRLDMPLEQPLDRQGTIVGAAMGELAFLDDARTLLRAPLSGGDAREVAREIDLADWSRDGSRFAVARTVGKRTVLEYPIGTVVHETVGSYGAIAISPSGDEVAFIHSPHLLVVGGVVGVVRGGRVERLASRPRLNPQTLAWSSDGREVLFTYRTDTGNVVEAVSRSGRARRILSASQETELMATGVEGQLLMGMGEWRRTVAGAAPGASQERDLTVRDRSLCWEISPDGRTYLASDFLRGRPSAFLGRIDGSSLVRLGEGVPNSLSPDGRSVLAFKEMEQGYLTQLTILPTGAGEPRDVPRGTIDSYVDARFLPDGRRLVMTASEPGKPRRVFVQELPDGLPKPVTPEGVFAIWPFSSPDGAWVAAGSDYRAEPSRLYPLDGGEPRPIPGLDKGDEVMRFHADGRRLFVRLAIEDVAKAKLVLLDLETGRKQPWREVGPADPTGVTVINHVLPTPDGRGYVYEYERTSSQLYLVEGLR